MNHVLELGYRHTVERLGNVVGHTHVVVAAMRSRYLAKWGSANRADSANEGDFVFLGRHNRLDADQQFLVLYEHSWALARLGKDFEEQLNAAKADRAEANRLFEIKKKKKGEPIDPEVRENYAKGNKLLADAARKRAEVEREQETQRANLWPKLDQLWTRAVVRWRDTDAGGPRAALEPGHASSVLLREPHRERHGGQIPDRCRG